jgi:16S rRNA (adenine1518-N6/adenine1519-N6)-dimethyltransferase
VNVRPKKFLGQHFLKDQNIAVRIVDALSVGAGQVLEIGPGTGALTHLLLARQDIQLKVVEIDRDSVAYLKNHFHNLPVIEGDFLEMKPDVFFAGNFSIIGNFPYNISSQIFFRVLDDHGRIPEIVGMLQKEVADRIASPPGNKTYGILSVLMQTWYDIDVLFKVPPGVFFPPPKVMSAVIRFRRNQRKDLGCDAALFKKVVKQAFQTRRKTLRNALKNLTLPASLSTLPVLDKRAEQLTVDEFIALTQIIETTRE